jgi:hypothetical protein
MAANPHLVRLKHSTDGEASIVAAIGPDGSHAITRGELVIGIGSGQAKIYTIDQQGVPVPVVSGFPFGIDGGDFDLGSFAILNGSRLPLLGTSPATTYEGWTRVVNETNRTQSYTASLPFSISFAGDSYNSFFLNRGSFITFGVDEINPVLYPFTDITPYMPRITIDSAPGHEYFQRVYIQSNSAYYRIRFEGDSTSGTLPGQSDRVFELTFVNPELTNTQLIELRTGGTGYYNRNGVTMLADYGVIYAQASDILVEESWVFSGNEDGTDWEMLPYHYLDI